MPGPVETIIRQSLIRREAEGNYNLFQTQEYKEKLDRFVKTVAVTTLDELKKYSDKKISLDELLSEVKRDLLNPEALMKFTYEGARNTWMSKEDAETYAKNLINTLKESGQFGGDAVSETEKAWFPVFEIFAYRDKIIQNLVDIAKREGLGKATTKEAQYEATRMVFPTAEEYMEFLKKKDETFKKLTSGTERALEMDGEVGKIYSALLAGVVKGIEGIAEEVMEEWDKKEIKEIYNVQL